jgi:hypothetical protein
MVRSSPCSLEQQELTFFKRMKMRLAKGMRKMETQRNIPKQEAVV